MGWAPFVATRITRPPVPRAIQLWKDKERETGYDKAVLLDLRDRLANAAAARFDGRLDIDEMEAVDSKGNELIQATDLYTGAINRTLNTPGNGPKDDFARWLLGARRQNVGANDTYDDIAYRVGL
jgi:hypothetical protein